MRTYTHKNRTGERHNMLVAISRSETCKHGHHLWEYLCDCGSRRELHPGHAKTQGHCGCMNAIRFKEVGIKNTKHGKYGTGSYKSWRAMKTRCMNPKHPAFSQYSKVGICESWMDFENFYRDMGDRPEGMTLDRIDNNKGYCSDNCRWATHKEQRHNGINIRIVNGKPLTETAREIGINPETLRHRLLRGWTELDAISMPTQTKYSNAK